MERTQFEKSVLDRAIQYETEGTKPEIMPSTDTLALIALRMALQEPKAAQVLATLALAEQTAEVGRELGRIAYRLSENSSEGQFQVRAVTIEGLG